MVDINNFTKHFVYEKPLQTGFYEVVMPYEILIYRSPMSKFYQVEYKSQLKTININLISDAKIKEAYNANIKFFQMF